jgi:hypothetical protein
VSKATLERTTTPRGPMSGTGKQYGYGIEIGDAGRDLLARRTPTAKP